MKLSDFIYKGICQTTRESRFYQSLNAQEQREVDGWLRMKEVKDYFISILIDHNLNTSIDLEESLVCSSIPYDAPKTNRVF